MLYPTLRKCLFALPPECAHALALHSLNWLPAICFPTIQSSPLTAMGILFPNRVGLAAGLDKDGKFIKGLSKLAVGFLEIGTITPLPQPGNPKPRLFRFPDNKALVNRMGFNNEGVDVLVERLIARPKGKYVLGVNIGKNKATSLNQAANDYVRCLEKVYVLADYITINISSPNTEDLRQLQQGSYIVDLLIQLQKTQQTLAEKHQRFVPLVVKCSPDEAPETLKKLAAAVIKHGVSGIIATNTTVSRFDVDTNESGGLSGRPLFDLSTTTLSFLKKEVGEAVTLIAAGGIDSESSAKAKLAAGATLLQLYTGLIYEGPGLIKKLISPSLQGV